jgi:hypothetical protein
MLMGEATSESTTESATETTTTMEVMRTMAVGTRAMEGPVVVTRMHTTTTIEASKPTTPEETSEGRIIGRSDIFLSWKKY